MSNFVDDRRCRLDRSMRRLKQSGRQSFKRVVNLSLFFLEAI
jgi:hypothetical protein